MHSKLKIRNMAPTHLRKETKRCKKKPSTNHLGNNCPVEITNNMDRYSGWKKSCTSWFIPLFIGFRPSKVMQDFFHPQYVRVLYIYIYPAYLFSSTRLKLPGLCSQYHWWSPLARPKATRNAAPAAAEPAEKPSTDTKKGIYGDLVRKFIWFTLLLFNIAMENGP